MYSIMESFPSIRKALSTSIPRSLFVSAFSFSLTPDRIMLLMNWSIICISGRCPFGLTLSVYSPSSPKAKYGLGAWLSATPYRP